jgi:maltodextrin utilization protein YvdJ
VALYVALKDHGYIDPGTTENVFTAIFSDLSVVNLHRVTWIKKAQKNKQIAKNAIIALFDILIGKEKIAKVEDRSLLFKTLEACFSDESGKPLSFSYGNARQDKPSNEYHTIETIVSSL